jgi:hypothetical protein
MGPTAGAQWGGSEQDRIAQACADTEVRVLAEVADAMSQVPALLDKWEAEGCEGTWNDYVANWLRTGSWRGETTDG